MVLLPENAIGILPVDLLILCPSLSSWLVISELYLGVIEVLGKPQCKRRQSRCLRTKRLNFERTCRVWGILFAARNMGLSGALWRRVKGGRQWRMTHKPTTLA